MTKKVLNRSLHAATARSVLDALLGFEFDRNPQFTLDFQSNNVDQRAHEFDQMKERIPVELPI